MTDLNHYLARHYVNQIQLAGIAQIGVAELDELIAARLIPAPSYVVSDDGKVTSFVFGQLDAPGATPGRYFHPAQSVWIARAREAPTGGAAHQAESILKQRFTTSFAAALAALNLSLWRLPDSFDEDGAPIANGLQARLDSAWTYFLNGTFNLCVANPISEAHIAYKEVLQEKLAQQSENGSRDAFTPQQARDMHGLIDAYAAASMRFSPAEYPVSSRKRLVDGLRARLAAANMD